jgi:hypothetical protein
MRWDGVIGLLCIVLGGHAVAAAQPLNAVGGLTLGMRQADALPHLREPVRSAATTGSWGSTLHSSADGVQVMVCRGRVSAVTQPVPGDLHTYARLVMQETAVRGEGRAAAISGVGDQGDSSTVSANWEIPGGVFRLTYWVYGAAAPVLSKQLHVERLCDE